MSVIPHGESNWLGPLVVITRSDVRRPRLRPERVVDPYASTTTSTNPALIAAVACCNMTCQTDPPTIEPSTHDGRMPRYSQISTGASCPRPPDMKPPTSSLLRPASASARVVP